MRNKKEKHKKQNKFKYILILLPILLYLTLILNFKKNIFNYRFNKNIIEKYKRSQDIPKEVPGRLFLSDSDIHIASAYLYLNGAEPTEFNFQHPPLIKYLFGISIKIFSNPFIMQIIFGITYIVLTYILSIKLTQSSGVALLSSLLLAVDPLLVDLTSQALLDLGQSVFAIFYVISFLFYTSNPILPGIALGLLAGSKFWGAALFFYLTLQLFFIYKHKFNLKKASFQLLSAAVMFSVLYIPTFIQKNGFFNILFFELKTVKYWLNHSVASIPGASLLLFLSGYFKSWWGKSNWLFSTPWSFLWPASLITSIYYVFSKLREKKNDNKLIIGILPFLYLLFLGVQAPFTRYFVIVLPYLYITLAIHISNVKINFNEKSSLN